MKKYIFLTILATGSVHFYYMGMVDLLKQGEFWQKVTKFTVRGVFCIKQGDTQQVYNNIFPKLNVCIIFVIYSTEANYA